jgi:urease accessory protein UreF
MPAWQAGVDTRDAPAAIAARLDAVKVVPVVRETSIKLGRRTADLIARLYPGAAVDVDPPHHAVVAGAAARRLEIPLEPMLHACAHSLANGTLAAAIRCMPVSPAQAQALLVELHPRIVAAVRTGSRIRTGRCSRARQHSTSAARSRRSCGRGCSSPEAGG